LAIVHGASRKKREWITNKCPDQMLPPFVLWTAQAVRELVPETLGLSTIQLGLKRWDFACKKAAPPRDPRKIATWLEQHHPSVAP